MGLLDDKTHKEYYQGNDFGNYQFVSLDDIITQFEIAYVGENKIIPKIKRIDIAFHAQRALAELSFDTFKSIKSQQIDLPPTLVMPLPHDYVNYTKLSWVDLAGIKHPLYRTNSTSNPFQIRQLDNGNYNFPSGETVVKNSGFDDLNGTIPDNWNLLMPSSTGFDSNSFSAMGVLGGKLRWSYVTKNGFGHIGWSQVAALYQQVDVSDLLTINVSADGSTSDITFTTAASASGTAVSTIRFGFTTQDPSAITNFNNHPTFTYNGHPTIPDGTTFQQSPLGQTDFFDITYLEWTGDDTSTKTIDNYDVSNLDTIYVVALSFIDSDIHLGSTLALKPEGVTLSASGSHSTNSNYIDNINITNAEASSILTPTPGNETNSSTWNNYKSHTSSENNHDDYEDDTYWPMAGNRYGLDPQHAQVNGSFYVDNRIGRIHFSSNISGKTVILDYISDSLGTDAEMQVHKFAEDAMYKCIAYAILSTSSYGQGIVRKFQRDKFAAVRNAKLRLSSLKLEELTQILRGKSKQIKH